MLRGIKFGDGSSFRRPGSRVARNLMLSAAVLLIIAVILALYKHSSRNSRSPNIFFLERLRSANHFESSFPAQKYAWQVVREAKPHKADIRRAAVNVAGMELRDVSRMRTGAPKMIFAMLSHLGGYGEIIWVDEWTNFPVKMPPSSDPPFDDVPRREALQAALDAVKASGGCFIKAGAHRYLVAKTTERQQYEEAIRTLGWLDGKQPPWAGTAAASDSKASVRSSESHTLQPETKELRWIDWID